MIPIYPAVFISYSSKDKQVADAICRSLETDGIHCWIAPRDISPSEDWPSAITQAIRTAKLFILIFSEKSNSSNHVHREVQLAVDSQVPVLPFRIEEFQLSPKLQYYLSSVQWLKAFPPPADQFFPQLLQTARQVLGLPEMAKEPSIEAELTLLSTGENQTSQAQAAAPGQSLCEYVPQSLAEVLEIAGQVCAALEKSHAVGIFHRDLRLESVVITPSKTVILSDYDPDGSPDGPRRMGDEAPVGSFLYLAPELLMGQAASVQSDLYALGAMLYELACGQPPFKGDDTLALISQHLHTTPVPPSTYNPAIPPGIETLILRLLSKQPGERPASAAEVRMSLGQAARADANALSTGTPLDRMVRGRLIAREQELSEVAQMWAKACQGESGVLLISGEPGVGKSRLVREMTAQVQMERGVPLVGECYAEGSAPYAAFAQMILNVPEWPGDLPQLVLADLISLAPALRVHYTNVPLNPTLEPMAEQQRLYESAFTFFACLARHAPLLLVLEDMHWADGGTLALAHSLARRFRQTQTPALMVLTFREGELTEQKGLSDLLTSWNRERMASPLKLYRLDRQGTQALLEALFAEGVTTDFADGVYRETEGNPFFIEEICKALIEGGQVYRENGRWQRRSSSALDLPRSIRMAIETRLRGLPEFTREVLSLAAVLGRRFEFDVLQAAAEPGAGQDEDALIAALEGAEHLQLLYEVGRAGGATFEFAHALISTTLVAGISGMRRRRLHRRVLAALEKLHPEDYRSLAHHCLEAGEEARALDFLLKAGRQARATFANTEAVANYQQAIGLLNELRREPVPGDGWQGTARQLYEDLGDVLELSGQHEQAWTAYQNVLELLPASEPVHRSSLYRKVSRTHENLRQYAEAEQFYRQAETALGPEPAGTELEWWQEWVALQLNRMTLYYWPGRVQEMMELADKVRPAVERYGTLLQRSNFYNNLVLAAMRRDRYVISDEILENARRAASFIKEIGYGSEYNFQMFALGFCLLWRGDLAEAESHLLFSLQACERAGDVTVETRCLTYLTITFRKRGDIPRVQNYAARSLEAAATGQMIEYTGMAQANQAWALRREGKLEEARRLIKTAWETMHKTVQAQMFAWVAVWPLLAISLEEKRVVDAVEYARLLLSPKTQPQPQAIAASLQSAILAWEQGSPEQAYAALIQAADLAEPLGYI